MQINLAPDPSLLVIMAIFIANYFVVRKFFFRPVNEVLNSREQDLRAADVAYEEALARFSAATADVEARLHQAKREGTSLREGKRAEASSYRNELLTKARTEADALVSDASARLTEDVAQARSRIERDAEQLARATAERLAGRSLA